MPKNKRCTFVVLPAARIFIDKPLLYTPDIQQLVALCAIADTLVERVQKLPKSAPSFDVSILEQIEQLCKEIASTKHAQVRQGLHVHHFCCYLS